MKQSAIINRRKSAYKRRTSLVTFTNAINFRLCIPTDHAIERFIERINPNADRQSAAQSIQHAFKNADYVGRHTSEEGKPSRVYRNGALIMRLAVTENVVLTVFSK